MTILTIVFITNAINLIDGIDGLASGLSSVALLVFGFLFIEKGLWIYSMLAFSTFGAVSYTHLDVYKRQVIPLWVEQMMDGKPITITDPDMTRFMMTLDDAVDLVIYAFTDVEKRQL